MAVGRNCCTNDYIAVVQLYKLKKVNEIFENYSENFSLTGAAFNCSSYQQPRRGRGTRVKMICEAGCFNSVLLNEGHKCI